MPRQFKRQVENNENFKTIICKNLPREFKVDESKTGLIINVYVDTNIVGGWDKANKLVYALCDKIKKENKIELDEIGAGTDMSTMVRDWEFVNTEVAAQMTNEAKDVLKVMKVFFKRWGNSYCSVPETYDIIEKMRDLIETDEA